MAINRKSTNNKYWRGCGEKGTLLRCWRECKLIQPLWRAVWRFLKKLKIELPYDPAIPLLGIYPQKTVIQRDTCRGFPGGAVVKICLPMQGTQVRALVWEDPMCRGATKPVHHNYWACALEPVLYSQRATTTEPVCLEPVLHNKRSHHNEKPTHCNEE